MQSSREAQGKSTTVTQDTYLGHFIKLLKEDLSLERKWNSKMLRRIEFPWEDTEKDRDGQRKFQISTWRSALTLCAAWDRTKSKAMKDGKVVC